MGFSYCEQFRKINLHPKNKSVKHAHKNNNAHTEASISIGDVVLTPFYFSTVLSGR